MSAAFCQYNVPNLSGHECDINRPRILSADSLSAPTNNLSRRSAYAAAYLERLALALASPHSENERHADVWQVHVVLANVNHQLVHEGGSDVQSVSSDIVIAASVTMCKILKQQRRQRVNSTDCWNPIGFRWSRTIVKKGG